jgi:hypothetical protein
MAPRSHIFLVIAFCFLLCALCLFGRKIFNKSGPYCNYLALTLSHD